MKVYILIYSWNQKTIEGVYKTWDLAEAARLQYADPYRTTCFDIQEFEVKSKKPKALKILLDNPS